MLIAFLSLVAVGGLWVAVLLAKKAWVARCGSPLERRATKIHLEAVSEIKPPDREVIYELLRQHNLAENERFMQAMGQGAAKPLVVIARDENGQVLGGLIGDTLFDWLRVQVMAVHPQNRGAGIGGELLRRAEQAAKARGCARAYVDTMSFQSPEFYRRSGYAEIGQIPNWDSHGHSKHFFTKGL